MKIEKIYGVGSNILVSFTQASVSDSVRVERLREENADVFVGEKMTEMPWLFVPSRCNGKQLALDASVITGGTLDTIQIGKVMSEPKKIIRSGEYTTVLWMDGTKTIVKRMPGSEDSDYAAFTAALAKKVYGTNSKVERIVSMTERVKTKAEKKAEKKAKKSREKYVKTETTEPEKIWYRVKKNGIIVESFKHSRFFTPRYFDFDNSVWVYATSEEEARKKAIEEFVKTNKIYYIDDKGSAFASFHFSATDYAGFDKKWGIWEFNECWYIYVFANSEEEAVQLAKEIPRE